MKTFPRFTESHISLELKQPHFKIFLLAMQALLTRFEAELSPEAFQSLLDDGQKRQGITFAADLTQNPSVFKTELENANWALLDAYCVKKSQYVDAFLTDINEHFDAHYDREIFDLAQGETLKIADSGSIYG